MKVRSILIKGCLCASFFVACQQQAEQPLAEETTTAESKELEMRETSELADLMNTMYAQNAEVRAQLLEGNLPESFPDDFLELHKAAPTPGILHGQETTFEGIASGYLARMEELKQAQTVEEAKVAYNALISTCASCHQVFCHGPLQKINKLKLPTE